MRVEPLGTARLIRVGRVRLRRTVFFALTLGTTAVATAMMIEIVRDAGVTPLEVVILCLFAPTFGWISVAFWNAVLGFTLQLFRRDPLSLARVPVTAYEGRGDGKAIFGRTALVMPAHNEDPKRVVRGLEAMIRSLEATGRGDRFAVHLLSDTTDADIAREEEAEWVSLRERVTRPDLLHYRRRPANRGRKAGNIADFCAQWSDRYDFVVVLDADSIMTGSTITELVRRMEANPDVGLIQTVPIPARQETLFGRFVQFPAALYSPMLATGQCFWQGDVGNYWGHNAIIRVRPFVAHCRLPVLSGRPPLGGPVLSHDFVEAALLRRAGWRVYLLPDVGGSFEEVPSNIVDFAKRDRRWAQGSLQHLRLLREPGLETVSRVHFSLGAMGYLSSVLWLLILLASTAYVLVPALGAQPAARVESGWIFGPVLDVMAAFLPLLAVTGVVLFLPKVLGVLIGLLRRREAFGGVIRLLSGALLEAAFAVVVAPLMMMYHTRFVLEIALGRDVHWGAQPREGRQVSWIEAWRHTLGITLIGAVWATATLLLSPSFFLWLTPIFAGLLLAAPLVRWTSSVSAGQALKSRGLLSTPSETDPPPELQPALTAEPSAERGGAAGRRAEYGGALGAEKGPRSERDASPDHMFAGPALTLGAGTTATSMYQAERGLFDLQRGRAVFVTSAVDASPGHAVLVAAVEGLRPRMLTQLRELGAGSLRLVVTPHRASMMGVRDGVVGVSQKGVSLSLNGESPEDVLRLASTTEGVEAEELGARHATRPEAAGLELARLGRMLPAIVRVPADPTRIAELAAALEDGSILRVDAGQVSALVDAQQANVDVTFVSDAPVPIEEAENVRFMLFREGNGLTEHVAILIGDREAWPDPVPARLHSACLTGDLFGSLRCDCGEQLRGSLRVLTESGGGVLLYLEQEGRGIGLGNKLRAYALQQEGLDTVDADCVLGFGADERRYHGAVGILRHLGIERVQLLTNNPEKLKALEEGGIRVMERRPLHGTLNRHNLPYVRAKVQRAGHWLGDMLRGGSSVG